jgi:probable HAF family extracellular repeat protein
MESRRFDQGGTTMRDWLQVVRHLVVVLAVVGCLSGIARADALYSVTNLGPASMTTDSSFSNWGVSYLTPSGSYLGALSPADQATFQAGSFDVYAHSVSASSPGLPINPDLSNINGTISGVDLVTSNNQGDYVGTTQQIPQGAQDPWQQVIEYTPDAHTVTYNMWSQYTWAEQGAQSSGYYQLVTIGPSVFGQFIGSISGINDHGVIALSAIKPGVVLGNLVPYLQGSTISSTYGLGAINLGSLGGSNGAANALNNSSQAVGWSQTADGAQHAFVYSNGTMQDLNLLIPTSANINLIDAVGIDASGQIVAYGTDSSGQMDEFLLTPQGVEVPAPEPSTLAVFGLMIAAAAAHHIRSRHPAKS